MRQLASRDPRDPLAAQALAGKAEEFKSGDDNEAATRVDQDEYLAA